MSREEVLAFFECYREVFDRLDGDAVADLWHLPCAIFSAKAEDLRAMQSVVV